MDDNLQETIFNYGKLQNLTSKFSDSSNSLKY